MPLRGLVLVIFFVASLPVCFARPFYGVLLWTVVAFLNPQAFTWSAADALPWALLVAIPTLSGFFVFMRTGLDRFVSREALLILLLWLWFTVTTLVSTNTPLFLHHAADTWYRWSFVSKILLMTLFLMPIVNTFARLRTYLLVVSGCFGIFVVKMFPFIIATGGKHRLYGPPRSMIADNNDFGLALNMTLPLFFFLAQTETNKWSKRLFAGLFLITIPAIFFTYSRGALVGLIAVTLLMLVQLKQRLVLIPVVAVGIAVAIGFAPGDWKNRMDPTRQDAVDASARSRLNAWAYARNLAAEFPVTGGGFATFTPELFDRYAPTAKDIHGAHSIYFQVLAEHGYVGLLLYLSLVASCFLTAHGLVKRAKWQGDQTTIHYVNMLRFSMVAFLASGTFLGRAYFDYFFALVACLVVLKKVAQDEWAEQTDHDEFEDEDQTVAANAPALSPTQEVALWHR